MQRKIIEINEELCDGCGKCATACAEGAIQIINGKAKLVSDRHCDGLGSCLGHCHTGALKIIEREAAPFDETILSAKKPEKTVCSCPSHNFKPGGKVLQNWPIQLRLVAEKADFFDNADLVIAADCTAFSCADFSQKIQDKILLICCPKLDETEMSLQKMCRIFSQNNICSITVLRMKVPCCAKLTMMVKGALQIAGKHIPCEEIVL